MCIMAGASGLIGRHGVAVLEVPCAVFFSFVHVIFYDVMFFGDFL
jgi:hypothetical protein